MKKLVFIVFLLFSLNAWAANDRGLFWRVQSNTATVYLLGSIHYANASFYPMRKVIRQAFDRSQNLVVEVNMDKAGIAKARKLMQEKGFYHDGDTIQNHLDADTYARLRKLLQHMGVSYATVKNQKPGMLIMTLTATQVMQMGLDPDDGIDEHFIHLAETSKKPVLQLETILQQINVLLKIADGNLLMQESLNDFEQVDSTMHAIVQDWKRGDEKKLNAILFGDVLTKHPSYQKIYDELIFDRNRGMAKKIETYLKTKQTYFVVVGAGHLVGDKSVIALLGRKGYKAVRF